MALNAAIHSGLAGPQGRRALFAPLVSSGPAVETTLESSR